jgi:hypothetical protein
LHEIPRTGSSYGRRPSGYSAADLTPREFDAWQ